MSEEKWKCDRCAKEYSDEVAPALGTCLCVDCYRAVVYGTDEPEEKE